MHRRVCVAVLLLLGVVTGARVDAQPAVCESTLPPNISAESLGPVLLALARLSDTLQQQCVRIASMPRLRVHVTLAPHIDSDARAQATLSHFEAGAIRADIVLRFGEDYTELLPHELEHVLEQAEGVNLQQELKAGRAWLLGGGAYETRRAQRAGVRARREVEASLAAEAAEGNGRKPPHRRDPFD